MICFVGICKERERGMSMGSTTKTHSDGWYLHLCTIGLVWALGTFFSSDYTRCNEPFSIKSFGA